jgi:hypothetical protein
VAKGFGKKSVKKITPMSSGEVPKRLTPTDDTTRMLYLLSGNNCAMPDCKGVIVDRKGAIVGDIAHIEGALPDSARFNPNMTNEQRRELSNLVLLCASHHRQVDHNKLEAKWPVTRLRKVKAEHEAKFGAIGESIQQAFREHYNDRTDDLGPTEPATFARLDAMQDDAADEEVLQARAKELKRYIKKLRIVPEAERAFMLAVLQRWQKVRSSRSTHYVSVDVDDLRSALSMSLSKVQRLGEALSRYDVGYYGEVGLPEGDRWHVGITDPSDYLPWAEIIAFCKAHSIDLRSFVINLDFAQVD